MVAKNSPSPADRAGAPLVMASPFASVFDEYAAERQLGLDLVDVHTLARRAGALATEMDVAARRRQTLLEALLASLPKNTDCDEAEAMGAAIGALQSDKAFMELVCLTQEMARRAASAPPEGSPGAAFSEAADLFGHLAYLASAARATVKEAMHSEDVNARGWLCVAAEQTIGEIGWVADRGSKLLNGSVSIGGASDWLLPRQKSRPFL